jgi:hypothetical protein
MAALARDRKVLQLARDLGLPARGDALAAIRGHALRQVGAIMGAAPISVDTLETLRRVVADKFRVKVELIESDADIARIEAEHADFSPYLHKQLSAEFLEGTTEGVTIERDEYDPFRCRFLVVADARGDRRARAYFTVWHELSHLLVHPEQLPIPGFRRTPPPEELAKDPIEQVVDHVAGHVAFYEPLFRPAAEAVIATYGGVTFDAIEEIRARAGIVSASLFATAMQAILYTPVPMALVTVGLVLKPAERRKARSPQADLGIALPVPPTPQPRLTACIPNHAADRAGLRIWRHMRVPAGSALSQVLLTEGGRTLVAAEDQSWWETSDKGPLPSLPLRVEAIRLGRFVYGLISVAM